MCVLDKFILLALLASIAAAGNLDEGGLEGRRNMGRKVDEDFDMRKSDENSPLGVPKCCARGHSLEVTTSKGWKCIEKVSNASESIGVPLAWWNGDLKESASLGWRCGGRKGVGFGSDPRWTQKLLLNKQEGLPEFVIDRFGGENSKDESPLQLYHLEGDSLHEDFCWDQVVTSSSSEKMEAAVICVEEEKGGGEKRKKTKETSCQDRPCVKTCCLPGHTFDDEEGKCIADDFLSDEEEDSSAAWQWWPQVDEEERGEGRGYDVLSGFPPDCSSQTEEEVLAKFDGDALNKMQIDAVTGELALDKDIRVGSSKFCLNINSKSIYACVKINNNNSVILDRVVLVLSAASVPFLVAALVVVCSRNNKKKNVANSGGDGGGSGFVVLAAFMICALLPFFVLYVALLVANPVHLGGLCVAGGLAMQFFYLSSLAWLNCMCFTVWSSLKSITLISK